MMLAQQWPLFAAMLAVPLADQGTKWALRRALAGRRLALGRFGCLQLSEARIWLARFGVSSGIPGLWVIWLVSAAAVAAAVMAIPIAGGLAGILLGGTLSHLIEVSLRGSVTDFIRLKFWPAFNLADLAIVAGGVGFGAQALWAIG